MRNNWYFIFPGIVIAISIISYVTIYLSIRPVEFCFSNVCWENLLKYFSFSFQSFAAGVVLLTLCFTMFRIQQTQVQLDNQGRQLDIQQRQITHSMYFQFRNEFKDFFERYHSNSTIPELAEFRFQNIFLRIFPDAQNGDRGLAESLHNWLSRDFFLHFGCLNEGLDQEQMEAYYLKSYSNHLHPIYTSFENLFHLSLQINKEIYSNIIPRNHLLLISDKDQENNESSYGGITYDMLSEILSIILHIDNFIGNKYFKLSEIDKMKDSLQVFKSRLMRAHGLDKEYQSIKKFMEASPNSRHLLSHRTTKNLEQKSGLERDFILHKLDENESHNASELASHLRSRMD